jgi:hypothetical protein
MMVVVWFMLKGMMMIMQAGKVQLIRAEGALFLTGYSLAKIVSSTTIVNSKKDKLVQHPSILPANMLQTRNPYFFITNNMFLTKTDPNPPPFDINN